MKLGFWFHRTPRELPVYLRRFQGGAVLDVTSGGVPVLSPRRSTQSFERAHVEDELRRARGQRTRRGYGDRGQVSPGL